MATETNKAERMAYAGEYMVPTEVARHLELERDQAREALKHIEEYGTEEINAAVELRQKLAQALVDLDNMQDQRDLAMKVIKRLELERDEARKLAQQMSESNQVLMADTRFYRNAWEKLKEIAK